MVNAQPDRNNRIMVLLTLCMTLLKVRLGSIAKVNKSQQIRRSAKDLWLRATSPTGSTNSENKRKKIELINAALEMAFELAPRPTNDEISRISRKVGLDLCKVQA